MQRERVRKVQMGVGLAAAGVALTVILGGTLKALPREEPIVRYATRNTRGFVRMGRPRPGEWRYVHNVYEEDFEEYKANYREPFAEPRWIVITPIGPFDEREREILDAVAEFAGPWFQREVKVEEGVDLPEAEESYRERAGGKRRQYLTRYLMDEIVAPRFQEEARVQIGATMADLYAGDAWNFVFGAASPAGRVGVYSFARLFEAFWGQERTAEGDKQAHWRACALVVHELGHQYGLTHCQKFKCNMNGSNSLEEADGAPLYLCPECLKMLQWRMGFDVIQRYRDLEKYYDAHGFTRESDWVRKRRERIERAVGGDDGGNG